MCQNGRRDPRSTSPRLDECTERRIPPQLNDGGRVPSSAIAGAETQGIHAFLWKNQVERARAGGTASRLRARGGRPPGTGTSGGCAGIDIGVHAGGRSYGCARPKGDGAFVGGRGGSPARVGGALRRSGGSVPASVGGQLPRRRRPLPGDVSESLSVPGGVRSAAFLPDLAVHHRGESWPKCAEGAASVPARLARGRDPGAIDTSGAGHSGRGGSTAG